MILAFEECIRHYDLTNCNIIRPITLLLLTHALNNSCYAGNTVKQF
jgi:hypothetical protein